jgi:hypothetical protein
LGGGCVIDCGWPQFSAELFEPSCPTPAWQFTLSSETGGQRDIVDAHQISAIMNKAQRSSRRLRIVRSLGGTKTSPG